MKQKKITEYYSRCRDGEFMLLIESREYRNAFLLANEELRKGNFAYYSFWQQFFSANVQTFRRSGFSDWPLPESQKDFTSLDWFVTGWLCLAGIFTKKPNESAAIKSFSNASRFGSEMGSCFFYVLGSSFDRHSIPAKLQELADGGHIFALCMMAGQTRRSDPMHAGGLYRQAAILGEPTAMTQLGILLCGSDAGSIQPEEGRQLLADAASFGDAEALVTLGILEHSGAGGSLDLKSAFQHIERSALLGNEQGIRAHAAILEQGSLSHYFADIPEQDDHFRMPVDRAHAAYWLHVALMNAEGDDSFLDEDMIELIYKLNAGEMTDLIKWLCPQMCQKNIPLSSSLTRYFQKNESAQKVLFQFLQDMSEPYWNDRQLMTAALSPEYALNKLLSELHREIISERFQSLVFAEESVVSSIIKKHSGHDLSEPRLTRIILGFFSNYPDRSRCRMDIEPVTKKPTSP